MALLGKILQILAAAVPALLEWWRKHEAAREQTEAEARRAAVRDDPTPAWMRKFNSRANPDASNQAGTDQPDGDK